MREKKTRGFISRFAIIMFLIFYTGLCVVYYKKPERFFFFLFKDLKTVKEKSLLGKVPMGKFLPDTATAVAKYKKARSMKILIGEDVSFIERVRAFEREKVGYFTYMLPVVLWERSIYFLFFSIPVFILSFFYFARLWRLKTEEIFITDPIKQKAFAFLQGVSLLVFLLIVGLPTISPHWGVMVLYTLPLWSFGKSYYSGAWLWRKRGGV